MTEPNSAPLFSVIIPTRERSDLFACALQSVLDQQFRGFEVIIVDDGSSDIHATQYRRLAQTASVAVRVLTLAPTPRGHGPSYATNTGARHASGDYLCFLDDDDQWTDPEHLDRVARVIQGTSERVDLILANQKAFQQGNPLQRWVWIEDLGERVKGKPDGAGAYNVTLPELLGCPAHCHLNTTIVSHRFFQEIGGFDVELRYEQDREFYLRICSSPV